MVASSITIDNVQLDGTDKFVLVNSVGTMEDNTAVKELDGGLVDANERWSRVKRNWQLSWSTSSSAFIENLYEVCRTSRGFLFISPRDSERICTAQACRNTVTGLSTGDGSTTTFQLQRIASTSAHSVTQDINYPLTGTVTGYKNAVSAPLSNVNLTTGVITFSTAPGNGVDVTASFRFAWPVKFASKSISTTWLEVDQVEVRSVQIEEIF